MLGLIRFHLRSLKYFLISSFVCPSARSLVFNIDDCRQKCHFQPIDRHFINESLYRDLIIKNRDWSWMKMLTDLWIEKKFFSLIFYLDVKKKKFHCKALKLSELWKFTAFETILNYSSQSYSPLEITSEMSNCLDSLIFFK